MSDEKYKDPVCGMEVIKDHAKGHSHYQGNNYYFCSIGCKTKFDANPQNYLKAPTVHEEKEPILKKYKPLIVILLVCILLSVTQSIDQPIDETMRLFMGYFFVLFAMFKFFDLNGFVDGFSTYDLIAKKFRPYGYVYPWLELTLGTLFLTDYRPMETNALTVLIMMISGIGVLKSIFSGSKIKCACLGTTLDVPLTTVSVIENFGMAAMSLYRLLTL